MVRGLVIVALACFLLACSPPTLPLVAGAAEQLPTPTSRPTQSATRTAVSPPLPFSPSPPSASSPPPVSPLPLTPTPPASPTPVAQWYRIRSGDTLLSIAQAHGTTVEVLMEMNARRLADAPTQGDLLAVPSQIQVTLPPSYLLHDSEAVYGPSYLLWNTQAFVDEQGGYLSEYVEGGKRGAQILDEVALKYHIGPRALLATMEIASGWVTQAEPRSLYAFGLADAGRASLRQQAEWAAVTMMEGYYGQLEGRRDWVVLSNRVAARLAPNTNPGSAAVANLLAAVIDPAVTFPAFLQEETFQESYRRLFGEIPGGQVRPPRGEQPPFLLPWSEGEAWYFTGGPHGGYGDRESGWAALDFAPPVKSGCSVAPFYVRAIAPGLVLGSDRGETWIDMDEDGDMRTGWVILYMHLATYGRIERGAWVQAGQVVGFPSCEGGHATGAHVHVARMYNGQWMPAHGPVPFQLGEWTASADIGLSYEGWLLNAQGRTLEACDCRKPQENQFPTPPPRRLPGVER